MTYAVSFKKNTKILKEIFAYFNGKKIKTFIVSDIIFAVRQPTLVGIDKENENENLLK